MLTEDKPCILFVDDEEKTRKYFARLFKKEFTILTAEDGVHALEVFEEHQDKIGVVITDQRMPRETGTQFLGKVAAIKPSTIRILSTAYADMDAAIDSVNKGGIYRYITKPWEIADLEITLRRAVELYELVRERDSLLQHKLSSLQGLAGSDRLLSLASMTVFSAQDMQNMDEGLGVIAQLADIDNLEEKVSDAAPVATSWNNIYNQHLNFLKIVSKAFPDDLTGGERLTDGSVNVNSMLDKRMPKQTFMLLREGGEELSWPGTEERIMDLINPLFKSLELMLVDAGECTMEVRQSGLELRLPSRLVSKHLKHLRQSTDTNITIDGVISFVGSLFKLAHFGARFDVFPETGKALVRLRLSFDPDRLVGSEEPAWEALARSLADNDMFWTRL
jgi:FixJ family two-component response regulator